MKQAQRESLVQSKRIIVKLGTSSILHSDGRPQGEVLLPLARQIGQLRQRGLEIVLVSSGAVGMGRMTAAGSRIDPKHLSSKQALAALGQVELMNMWRRLFELMGIGVAQVLLTRQELSRRERYLNARNTLSTLLNAGILPVVNENDSVATEEIRFGDNDILSAVVGSLVEADLIVNLTRAKGLMDLSQGQEEAVVISDVQQVDNELFELVAPDISAGGTGGMASKLHAAREAARYGASTVIASSEEIDILLKILEGRQVGTLFWPTEQPLRGKKRWLASSTMVSGSLLIDKGAQNALLRKGSSLLEVGVVEVLGEFGIGDIVSITGPDGAELGRGLSDKSSTELKTGERSGVVIHRNNLFLRD
ncbi:MAG: glutamate 5-kinase [Candidatus Eremiobacteraeota bacterium]|nr:glutamate 5-kinase [Candidatus Eremiobacteraeota bacterium]